MGQRFKIVGWLVFESELVYRGETDLLGQTKAGALVAQAASWSAGRVDLRFDADVSHDESFRFVDWVHGIAKLAQEGSLDVWQEAIDDDATFTRFSAGGHAVPVSGSFPR